MPPRTSRRKAQSLASATVAPRVAQKAGLLPRIKGPKTGPFRHPDFDTSSDFHFEELLDEPSSSSSEGGEGYVFKAVLSGRTYAVKFKFYDIEEGRYRFSNSQNEKISDAELIGNLDPFNAECRAYGCIEEIRAKYREKGIEIGPIAMPCHGYMSITPSHEREFVDRFGPLEFQRCAKDEGTELRALVKRYSPHKHIDPKKRPVKLMLRDLEIMHENGLYPIDIHAENYREGLLVDFGMALTEPSCVLNVVDDYVADQERGRGLGAFDDMIKDAGIKTKIRAANGPGWRNRTRAGTIAKDRAEFIQLVNRRGLRTEKQSRM
ncbi:hypothetical protein P171DRAFT_62301 [Karstenula rhodostoma CBS 690.94]|uniref:Protein kinase domain-containing protein n=1 Tax=Karstenula rhodostoma CBS 690.94 TaxID=1392251 RepID=A0A9P4UAE0_9PLEO|nr:hypothetical protein P171DRAFT_62301 [Karstenula rhodostoma CBS 690.94]